MCVLCIRRPKASGAYNYLSIIIIVVHFRGAPPATRGLQPQIRKGRCPELPLQSEALPDSKENSKLALSHALPKIYLSKCAGYTNETTGCSPSGGRRLVSQAIRIFPED